MEPSGRIAVTPATSNSHSTWLWEFVSRPVVLLRITFLLVFAAYIRTVTYDFVYDDFSQVVMNPWLTSWGGLKAMFTRHSWAFAQSEVPARYYRPMYLVWLWAIRMLSDGAPGWFHLAAILSHLVVTSLAFLLALRLLRDRRAAAVAALLFALHPTKTEAVTWVGAASEVVHAAFFFGVFIAYFRWREDPRWYWLGASVASFAGAVLAKETAVFAPLLVLTYEWMAPQPAQTPSRARTARRLAMLVAPYAVVGIVYFLVRAVALGGVTEVAGLSLAKSAYTAPLAFCWYLKELAWPFRLSELYPALIARGPEPLRFFGALVLLLVFAKAYWSWAKQSPEMKFLAVWFVATLLPVVAAVLLLQPHDRYLYLPSFAFAVVLAKLLSRLDPKRALGAALALALVYAATTYVEEQYWETDLRLFTRAVEIAPELPKARELLAEAYADTGNPAMGLKVLQDGNERAPANQELSYALGVAYYNRADNRQAESFFQQSFQLGPDDRIRGRSLYYLGLMAQKEGRVGEAESLLKQAVQTTPDDAGFRDALTNLLKQPQSVPESADPPL